MILVPVVSTALIGILCVVILWFSVLSGTGAGFEEREDFDRACMAIAEIAENCLKKGRDFSSLEELLKNNGMAMTVLQNGVRLYSYGDAEAGDGDLLSAAENLGGNGVVTRNGRGLFFCAEPIGEYVYNIFIFGGNDDEGSYRSVKIGLAMSAVLIVLTIFLSIFFTNRFLIRFVFRKIEEPLDILTNGVHEIRDGNLDYRIAYDGADEFAPVCEDFNEMAEKLKSSVERIQQQEKSRKELIAGISHDIRSPLTSIKAYVEGLLDGVAKTPEAQRKYLETIKTKAEDLNHIVSQLFLFSKMELGEYPDNPRRIRLDETIMKTVSALKEEYDKKGLSVKTELEPVSIYADPVQIERVTVNILENSLKYKEKERGQVVISLRRLENCIRLSFSDDGPGAPKEALPHLFEVFYRSDPARENPNKGSGLGLAIVGNAVERMGGSVEALPSESGGLEIRVEFPNGGTKNEKDTDN